MQLLLFVLPAHCCHHLRNNSCLLALAVQWRAVAGPQTGVLHLVTCLLLDGRPGTCQSGVQYQQLAAVQAGRRFCLHMQLQCFRS